VLESVIRVMKKKKKNKGNYKNIYEARGKTGVVLHEH
jgi:hypothetical protein